MIDRVAFTIFGISIYWYGILMATAILVGIFIGINRAKRFGYTSEQVIDFMIICLPLAIICARAYYVVFEWQNFADNPISVFYLRDGGLAMYGSLIGSVLAAFINSKRKKGIKFLDLLDIAAPPLILGQAIGRWGNFFNQEAYGYLAPSGWRFPLAVYIDKLGEWRLATFFYECVWNLLVFALLMYYSRKKQKSGNVFLLYLAAYGLGRMFIEQLRADSLWLVPDVIRVSQLLSFILLVGAGTILFLRRNASGSLPDLNTQESADSEIIKAVAENGENDRENSEAAAEAVEAVKTAVEGDDKNSEADEVTDI